MTTRPYRSELREQQAERTRLQIAEAARVRFLESGWSGTSVRSVAEAAGVSEATVYAVYGTKAGLAVSLVDAAQQQADVARAFRELDERSGDPAGQLGAFVSFDRRLFELGGGVIRLVTEARRQHPDLASAYAAGRARGDAVRRKVFAGWPSRTWRPGVDVDGAVDRFAVVVSLQTYDIAVTERGWTPDRVEAWWHATLVEQLLRH